MINMAICEPTLLPHKFSNRGFIKLQAPIFCGSSWLHIKTAKHQSVR